MQPDSLIGKTLSHYQVTEKLGAGGMGEVYLAQDSQLRRKVALKLLPAEFTKDEDRLHRFEQEAYAASALNHPNIITIYEIGQVGDSHFIATEFIDGQTLRQQMASKLRLAEALDLVIQVASALTAAHAAGILHRDVKPENVMLRPDGFVKVLDFGLAKLAERSSPRMGTEVLTAAQVDTDPGTVMGTAQYMSPEQARGLKVDGRTDVFSLGVVLYEMVAGRAPFEGATATDLIISIVEKEPALLSRYSQDVPAELQRIVTKALRKDREARYQTIKDLLIDLKSLREELEFKAKLERSGQPIVPSGGVVTPSGGQAGVPAAGEPAVSTEEVRVVRTTSSAEYLVSEVRRHKERALLALAILIVAGATILYFARGGRAIDSVAVLPFVNASADPNTEYLSDGITESLINSLSQVPRIKVIARSSVFRYKGRETDPRAVGRELGVQAVLTGRVMLRGDALSISAELMDARDNSHIWGDQYHRKLTDLLAVQEELARDMSEKLRLKLTGEEQQRLTKSYTENTEAFQLYSKGRYYWNKQTEDGMKIAIEYFRQAIDKDPNYALAYTGLADSYWAISDSYLPTKEAMPKAEAAALKALEIDDSLAEAHTSLAVVKYQYRWDWSGAEKEFKRAIELNPNYPIAHHQYGWYLLYLGREDEALTEMKRAQQLDPLSLMISVDINAPLCLMRRYDQSIEQSRKVIEMDPNFYLAHYTVGWASAQKKDFDQAIVELQKARALEDKPWIVGLLGYAYAASGRRGEAQKIAEGLQEQAKQRHVSPYWIAMIYVGLGERDEAFSWLEKAFEERSSWLLWFKTEPMLDTLRSDPRYADLLRRIGFPP